MSRIARLFLPTALILASLALSLPGQARAVTAQATPSAIDITMGYHGLPVKVAGDSAPGESVVVKVTSAPADIHLKYKGKAAGIFWMKLGTLIFKTLPGTYLVATSGPVEQVLSPSERTSHDIGYEALKTKAEIHAEHGDLPAGDWFTQFLEFKKKEQVYTLKEGAVQVNATGGYVATIDWPYQAQPGDYIVEVLTAKDGRVTGSANAKITVAMTGMVASIANLATNNRAVYGTLAIIIALAVGFAVGNIFKKGGGAH